MIYSFLRTFFQEFRIVISNRTRNILDFSGISSEEK